ncbi:unnamed protein product [Orchesella dallaii]|uniref:Leucine-rich repeat-containing protein 15 n=1 Tax=Orchesella dallaii TaxID=48710 RepID=A0ABP1R2K8_9HEXA
MMIPMPPSSCSALSSEQIMLTSRRRAGACSGMTRRRRKSTFSVASLLQTWLFKWGYSVGVVIVTLSCCVSLTSAQVRSVFDGNCPTPQCYCGLDARDRREVACTTGGLDDIPVSRMSPSIEVIRIIAPWDRPNHLTIGRFFRQFRRLQELHIVGSNVPSIGENNFWGMTNLKLLNLTKNKIDIIMESNFKGLSGLETLILSENSISSFVSASFEHLTNLTTLDLSRNRATKLVERLFYNLHKLEVLDLSENRLRKLDTDVFRDIWRLREFRCHKCGIRQLDKQLYALLPKLKILDLRYNEFTHLREEEFSGLQSLEELLLDGNRLTSLTEESFSGVRLVHLSLASNGLGSIDRTAFHNASVNYLDLGGNKFETLNKLLFLYLKHNLTKLDLSRNPRLKLASLLILLSENTRLRWLSLARNNYEDLPLDLFEDQRMLQHLNLSYNRLRELFPRQFTSLASLQVLDLSHNRLRGIEGEVLQDFDRISTIREIRLEGNPWSCDLCYIPAMIKWTQQNPLFRKGCLHSKSPYCLRCKAPEALYDKPIITIQESSLEWCDPYADDGSRFRLDLILIFIILLLIILLICLGLWLKYRFWDSADYYTHEESRKETGSTPPEYYDPSVDPVVAGMPDSHFYATINGTHTKMISTIDEKTFDPDTNFYPDLSVTLRPPSPYATGASSRPNAPVSPSISKNPQFMTEHHESFTNR